MQTEEEAHEQLKSMLFASLGITVFNLGEHLNHICAKTGLYKNHDFTNPKKFHKMMRIFERDVGLTTIIELQFYSDNIHVFTYLMRKNVNYFIPRAQQRINAREEELKLIKRDGTHMTGLINMLNTHQKILSKKPSTKMFIRKGFILKRKCAWEYIRKN